MKLEVEIDVDEVITKDLTECYIWAVEKGDDSLSGAAELVLERYYLSSTEWDEWKSNNREKE